MSPDVGAGDAYAEALAAAVTLLVAPDIARCVLGSDVHPSVIYDPAVRCALADLVLRDDQGACAGAAQAVSFV